MAVMVVVMDTTKTRISQILKMKCIIKASHEGSLYSLFRITWPSEFCVDKELISIKPHDQRKCSRISRVIALGMTMRELRKLFYVSRTVLLSNCCEDMVSWAIYKNGVLVVVLLWNAFEDFAKVLLKVVSLKLMWNWAILVCLETGK